MLVETCLVNAAVDGFNPDFEPGETTQNIVQIQMVQEPMVRFRNILKFRVCSRSTSNSQVVIL